jgi:hypothetical protein
MDNVHVCVYKWGRKTDWVSFTIENQALLKQELFACNM